MMWKRHHRRAAKARFGALSQSLLATPLDYIRADHKRQRDFYRAVEDFAEADTLDLREAQAIARFISGEEALHVRDEEEGLFPLLRLKTEPSDDIERVLGLLSGEHVVDENEGVKIAEGLRDAIASRATTLDAALRNALRAFTVRKNRHLALENAVVLPIASRRLTSKDLTALTHSIASRQAKRPGGR